MTFLNPYMLLGLLGVAAPVIIHLLNRRQARPRAWGAMRFVLQAMARQNRRILLEEAILLALRCLAVALLAVALARPFVPTRAALAWGLALGAVALGAVLIGLAGAFWARRRLRNVLLSVGAGLLVAVVVGWLVERHVQHGLWGSAPGGKDVAIVLDASGSMARGPTGGTLYDRARREAGRLVASAGPGDTISLFLAGPDTRAPVGLGTIDRRRLDRALSEADEPTSGTMRLTETLRAAAEAINEGNHPTRTIIVLTDGQAHGWQFDEPERWDAVADELVGTRSDRRTELLARTLPAPPTVRNLSVTALTPSRQVIGTDRPVRLNVTVANRSVEPSAPGEVTVRIEGVSQPLSVAFAAMDPGAAETVAVSHRFAEPGRYACSAEIDVADDLPADNRAVAVLRVRPAVPVLIVDGEDNTPHRVSPGSYLAAALGWDWLASHRAGEGAQRLGAVEGGSRKGEPGSGSEASGSPQVLPGGGGGEGEIPPAVIRPVRVAGPDVGAVEDLSRYRAVVLADMVRLPEAFARSLAQFVVEGGSLLVAPGRWVRPGFYNDWTAPDGRPVLPARLVERLIPDRPATPAVETFRHPAMDLLAEPARGGAIDVYSYWRLETGPARGGARIGARLTDGLPLLVEHTLGAGKVALLSVSLSRDDSTWPTHDSFVYFAHELLYHLLAGDDDGCNVPAGRAVSLVLADPAEGSGLLGTYFARENLTQPRFQRVDPRIDFRWDGGGPDSRVGNDNFAARWVGRLRPPVSGRYTFHLIFDDGVRLWVDGRKIIDQWYYTGKEVSGSIELSAGRLVDVRLEYCERGGGAACVLAWSADKLPRQVVPTERLYPPRVASEAGPAGQGDRGDQGPADRPGGQSSGAGDTDDTVPPGLTGGAGGEGDDGDDARPAGRIELEVVGPDGQRRRAEAWPVGPERALHVRFAETGRPGLYRLKLPERTAAGPAGSGVLSPSGDVPFAALRDPGESDLTVAGEARWDRLAARLARSGVRLTRARNLDEAVAAVTGETPGEEIWPYVLIAAVAAFLAETVLARTVSVRRGIGQTDPVTFSAAGQAADLRRRARAALRGQEPTETLTPGRTGRSMATAGSAGSARSPGSGGSGGSAGAPGGGGSDEAPVAAGRRR